MAQDTTTAAVLDVSTLVERPRVVIDGASYFLKHPDEFSLIEQRRMYRVAKRVVEIVNKITADESTEAEEDEYKRLVDQTCRQVLEAPDEVHAKLRDDHRVAISRAFSQLQSETNRQRAGASSPATPTTTPTSGTSSSPDSADSTAEIRSGG